MKLINSSVEILDQKPREIVIPDDMEIGPKRIKEELINSVYRQIELAGRTCYKSEDKITEDSAKGFVDRMIKSSHGAMLEHGTVYLELPCDSDRTSDYQHNKYSKVIMGGKGYAVTTNLRVLAENNWLDDLEYICEPTEFHEKRITVKWHCDRVTGESFLRHRVFSFARESTRYCNYSKGKFNNEITFIRPSWWTSEDNEVSTLYLQPWKEAEHCYLTLIENGEQPQQARQVLPFAIYSPLVMTGFISDWKGFFKLRSPKYGAKGMHPDAAKLADELYEQIKDKL